jgi:hypothetical protein
MSRRDADSSVGRWTGCREMNIEWEWPVQDATRKKPPTSLCASRQREQLFDVQDDLSLADVISYLCCPHHTIGVLKGVIWHESSGFSETLVSFYQPALRCVQTTLTDTWVSLRSFLHNI